MSTTKTNDDNQTQALDRMVHVAMGQVTQGVSPSSVMLAYLDWLVHLQSSPAKWVQLSIKVRRKLLRLAAYAICSTGREKAELCIEPLPQDHRFRAPQWHRWPFNLYCSAFLLTQQWWHNATTGVRGVSRHHEEQIEFMTRQLLDFFSSSNFAITNPEVIEATAEQAGGNFLRGLQNLTEDVVRQLANQEPFGAEEFRVGENVAVSPGKVVYRNELVELIQYSPNTEKVQAEPILFIPAWIMKYYILDLSSHNSVVKYLVDRGHTVFMVSWRNPSSEDAHLGMDDYRSLGVMLPLDVVTTMVPERKVHAVGYCLGGTMLTIAAATMARDGDDRLASVTLLATQTDFSEVGEISLFIDESQVTFLEDLMWERGYLDSKIFVVSTEKDHVAPWRSVYKLHLQADAPLTFVLTNGGHNAGIISEPGHPRRHFRVGTSDDRQLYVDPDEWFARTSVKEGSWWPEWESWLSARSSPEQVDPPTMRADRETFAALCDAPGTYVLQK